ncbi:MAG: multicopper oxidase domain-containing protein, partial [Gemmatimonadetes bacterium]|nr:multicopper oxidase domain-containing protein [Gemmatimonadota bacterium]NIR81409.1 multicopper oxidase domain-containing protein [Gemmatimonadota bacterium]NIT90244.1 multicopper oxidase domain-containing protein [Gemmatimonadota bacterium]NIU34072.1 multicopper oxidase domain-containing protein [Gemmatimonadota bacterium]NIU38229.1 multicopper oxidase domain-containing protein [Gemmatimonadota bacterium]
MEDGDTLDLRVAPVRRTIRGRQYLMYGYNDQYPGPLIRAPRGSTVLVQVRNEIPQGTTVHWHGVRLDNRFDGVPGLTQPPIEPGETFTYEVQVP